ncbi:hypothetical protein E2C01_012877 [Portunus trituberculatus]|uniref:Uncharacterized protein n=1 Tax=Portunus trituberculatus TaxID=210409 RepID=A0A5B7DF68_PORTR|nr:hypothetical protein [Portunus trituberculatus]
MTVSNHLHHNHHRYLLKDYYSYTSTAVTANTTPLISTVITTIAHFPHAQYTCEGYAVTRVWLGTQDHPPPSSLQKSTQGGKAVVFRIKLSGASTVLRKTIDPKEQLKHKARKQTPVRVTDCITHVAKVIHIYVFTPTASNVL